jgi:hypothetical protein
LNPERLTGLSSKSKLSITSLQNQSQVEMSSGLVSAG